jgi:hypothetical protein
MRGWLTNVRATETTTREKAALVQDDNSSRFYVGPAEAEPFKATARAWTLAPILSGWADEGVRPSCASCLSSHSSATVDQAGNAKWFLREPSLSYPW